MKRLILSIGIVSLIIVAIVASLPLFVSSATVRSYIVSQLTELTGRSVSFRGDPQVSFSPFLGIEINDLEVSDPLASEGGKPLLHVSKIQAQLDIFPALIGEIKITQYRLVRPMLNLKKYTDGNSNWNFKTGKLRDAYERTQQQIQQSESVEPVPATLGTFSIVDGVIQYEDTISDSSESITAISGTIRWPSTEDSASFQGTGIWHGENITGSVVAEQPMHLMAGGQSGMRWDIDSAPATLKFSGEANTLSNFFIKGNVELKTPSVRRLSDFIATDATSFVFPGAIELSGNIEATTSAIKVTEALATVAGHTGTGVLSLTHDEVGTFSLDGTLAFDTVDLTGSLVDLAENIEALSPSSGSDETKVDLRISASKVETGFLELNQVAAAINATGQNWTFDIGDAQIFEGNLVAKIGKRQDADDSLILVDLNASDINVRALFNFISTEAIELTGTGKVTANLRSRSLSGLMAADGLNGSLTASVADGAVNGINIPGLLANPSGEENSDFDETELGGNTTFQSTDFKLFITNGIASLSQATLNSDDATIKMIGRVDLRQGNLALRAQEITESGPEPERLFIGGTLKAPLVSLKKSSLEVNQSNSGDGSPAISN